MFEQLLKKSEPQSPPDAPKKKRPRRDSDDLLMTNDAWARAVSGRGRGSDLASSSGSQSLNIATPRSAPPEPDRSGARPHAPFKESVMVIGGWDEPTLRQNILEEVQILKRQFNFTTAGEP